MGRGHGDSGREGRAGKEGRQRGKVGEGDGEREREGQRHRTEPVRAARETRTGGHRAGPGPRGRGQQVG